MATAAPGNKPAGTPETDVAIDFGTTRSAWAYSVSGQGGGRIFVRIPASTAPPYRLNDQSATTKTDTVALIGRRGRGDLLAFGHAALDDYAASDRPEDQALFRWFKVDLCDDFKTGHASVDSVMTRSTGGHEVPLLGVMKASLLFFKDDVLEFLSRTAGRTVEANNVNWVVTVPAIYDDFAKRFMRQAAYEAGMIDRVNSPKLRLCLEPEAASLAAMKDNPLGSDAEGKTMMIIDCGGGTVDITTHEIVSIAPIKLEEVAAPSGGKFGSTRVDEAFKEWLRNFLGEWFEKIETTRTLVSIMMTWEKEKLKFEGMKAIRLNLSRLAEQGMDVENMENLRTNYNDGKLSPNRVGGKLFNLVLPTTLVTSFFTPTLEQIAECLRRIKRESPLDDLHRIYIVGGFSRSPLLREVIRAELDHPGCSIVDVHEPDLAIVTGAVMYSDRSTVFNSRKARLTYGAKIARPFNSMIAEHCRRRDAGKTYESDHGGTYVRDCFDVFIKRGDDLPAGGVLARQVHRPAFKDQNTSTVIVFATATRNPSFVDEEGCFEVGRVFFDLDMENDFEERGYRVEFTFGGPELTVKILHKTEEKEIAEAVLVMKRVPQAATYQSQ